MVQSSILEGSPIVGEPNNDSPLDFTELSKTYTSYLKLLARSQLDAQLRTRVSPSDVVQETLLEAHRGLGTFRGKTRGELLAWLRRILVNNLATAVEHHMLAAKRDVRRDISFDQISRSLEQSNARLDAMLRADLTSPSSDARRHEDLAGLADSLLELPEDYCEVIVLRHWDGLAFPAIAERMGRSSGAVRMLWLRAIEQLRQAMSKRGLA
jgi:RNA polymerase sigma-70 factor (ECF subfamily)